MKLSIYTPNKIELFPEIYHKNLLLNNHVYVAAKITGLSDWEERFIRAEKFIASQNGFPISPRILPPNMTQQAYMDICFSFVRNCNVVLFLKNWRDSLGAVAEHAYAIKIERTVLYEE